jgi:hypothetical protein
LNFFSSLVVFVEFDLLTIKCADLLKIFIVVIFSRFFSRPSRGYQQVAIENANKSLTLLANRLSLDRNSKAEVVQSPAKASHCESISSSRRSQTELES